MNLKTLVLMAGVSLAAVSAARAQTTVQQYPIGRIQFIETRSPAGNQDCSIVLRASDGSSFRLGGDDGGRKLIEFKRPGRKWPPAVNLSVSIDISDSPYWGLGRFSYTFPMTSRYSGGEALLAVERPAPSTSAMDDFESKLHDGDTLTVTDGYATSTFSLSPLSDIAVALSGLGRCVDRIVGERLAKSGGLVPAGDGDAAQPNYRQPATTEVPLRRDRYGTFTLLATLNGTTILPLTLDTGASNVTIPENIATELMRNGSLTPADYVGDAVSTLADGSKSRDTLYTLRSITVGGRTVTDVTCSVGDEGSSLLLGQSFLQKFASWSIDNVRGVLVLK